MQITRQCCLITRSLQGNKLRTPCRIVTPLLLRKRWATEGHELHLVSFLIWRMLYKLSQNVTLHTVFDGMPIRLSWERSWTTGKFGVSSRITSFCDCANITRSSLFSAVLQSIYGFNPLNIFFTTCQTLYKHETSFVFHKGRVLWEAAKEVLRITSNYIMLIRARFSCKRQGHRLHCSSMWPWRQPRLVLRHMVHTWYYV